MKKIKSTLFVIILYILKIALKIFYSIALFYEEYGGDKFIYQTIALYPPKGFGGLSTKIRFWNAPFKEIEKKVPKKGTVIDLGCGEGILTNYLATASPSRRIIGIELSARRVKFANRGLKNTQFIKGNVLKINFPKADSIIMSHMLHHLLSYNDQIKLLKKCYISLKKNGKLIIAEVDRGFNFKYLVGWITDILIVPILFENRIINTKIFHRSKKEWKKILKKNGFKVLSIQSFGKGPFPDIIMVCSRLLK